MMPETTPSEVPCAPERKGFHEGKDVDIEGVTGSIPVTPTIQFKGLDERSSGPFSLRAASPSGRLCDVALGLGPRRTAHARDRVIALRNGSSSNRHAASVLHCRMIFSPDRTPPFEDPALASGAKGP
ncbi:hypothetical protein GCM10011335_13410 [Aureimonas glaciei]|uniref:Uncharacterized protein n=1 Tax=Aureimonas glaciei TaxID=1776957 RepID=A0A916XUK0_9HYPH|nr:hypothetical protein GCM10011335_13410 [Aureimonas glaciei]